MTALHLCFALSISITPFLLRVSSVSPKLDLSIFGFPLLSFPPESTLDRVNARSLEHHQFRPVAKEAPTVGRNLRSWIGFFFNSRQKSKTKNPHYFSRSQVYIYVVVSIMYLLQIYLIIVKNYNLALDMYIILYHPDILLYTIYSSCQNKNKKLVDLA